MWVLLIGLGTFIGTHLISALPRRRHKLLKQFGEKNFKLGYSALSGFGLVLMIIGYSVARDEAPIIYEPPFVLRNSAMTLIGIAFVLLIAANLKGYIKWYVRHPMVMAVMIWAFGHLLVNGDAASLLLFGSLLGWAVFDRISLKKREQFGMVKVRDFEPDYKHDLIAVLAAGVIYWAFAAYLHVWLIGVPLI